MIILVMILRWCIDRIAISKPKKIQIMLIKRLLYLLLLFPFTTTISYSQVIITYDDDTKEFCIDIEKCDPCILGDENSQICKCREDCVIEENKCKEHCAHLVGNSFNHCLSKCYA